MSKNDVRFTDKFKQQIVELYRSSQSVNYLSNEYGVSNILIINWNLRYVYFLTTHIEITKPFLISIEPFICNTNRV